jgi:hypothetical protein
MASTTGEKVARGVDELDALANAIDDIDAAVKRMRSGKLNERALLLLISDASGVNKTDVQRVIEGMDGLKFRFRRRDTKGQYV